MKKPQQLRDALEAAIPALKKNPDRLKVFVDKGSLQANQNNTKLGFRYHYELNIIIIDFTKDAVEIFIPLMIWIHANQPDILTGNKDEKIAFEAEAISNKATDISLTIALSESVTIDFVEGEAVINFIECVPMPDLSGPKNWAMVASGAGVMELPLAVDDNGYYW